MSNTVKKQIQEYYKGLHELQQIRKNYFVAIDLSSLSMLWLLGLWETRRIKHNE